MTYLVIDRVKLYCSYGTCDIKLKTTPFTAPVVEFAVAVPPPQIALSIAIPTVPPLPNGVVPQFDAKGNLVAQVSFANGIPDGPSVSFDAQGRVSQKIAFVKGKIHGKVSIHTHGVLTAAMNFKAGVMEGASKFYDMKGQLAIETNFVGGVEQGARITYDVDTGAVLKTEAIVQGAVSGAAGLAGGIQAGIGLPPIPVVPEIQVPNISVDVDVMATIGGKGIATIRDHEPIKNIRPFCYCTSPLNPAVKAATKAAGGALQPQICTPMTLSPWVPGSHSVMLKDRATLTETSTLNCAYGGIIRVRETEQKKVEVP